MKLLDRYLLRELVGPFLFGVGVVLMLFEGSVIFQVLNNLDQQVSLWSLARILLFKVPYLLVWSAPVATLFASAFAINRLGRDNEITCIRGAGVSLRRICLPIASVGLLASIAAFLAGEKLVPWAERQANKTMREMALAQTIPQIQPNIFFNTQNYWFYIGSVQKIGTTRDVAVYNVLIYQLPEDGRLPTLITAKQGRSKGMEWTFEEAWRFQFDQNGFCPNPTQFQNLKLNLAQAVQDFWVNQQTAQELSTSELKQKLDQLGGSSTTFRSSAINDMTLDYHLRFSIPLSCLIFSLMAAPLSLRFARSGSFWGILLSIVLGFIYYNIIFFAKVVGANGAIPPVVAGWAQNVIFGLLALFLIFREE